MTFSISRRGLLRALAVAPAVVTGFGVATADARAAAHRAGLISPNVCLLSPEPSERPSQPDPRLYRSDITEGKPGVPMSLSMQVVDGECSPIEGARVDVWHCDAQGVYSGVSEAANGLAADAGDETFLCGLQETGPDGVATFATIYPGWYSGRTTHIHYRVWLDDRQSLTSQIFFPDALSAYLFQSVPPYNERKTERDTLNRADGIAQEADDGAYAWIREQPERYTAALVVGIDPDASG